MPLTLSQIDFTEPEAALQTCLDPIETDDEYRIIGMLSLSVGAAHSFEARSILWSLFRTLRPQSIVETGTNHGLTSAYMWRLAAMQGGAPRLRTFDIASTTLGPRIWKAIGAGGAIELIQGDSSTEVTRTCKPGIDFALIDGDLTYSGAEKDWKAIQPFLASRCIVLCDNMQHVDGCGRFFATLNPYWFHPELAFVARGFAPEELQEIFALYHRRLLTLWLNAVPAGPGIELRNGLRRLGTLLAGTPTPKTLEEMAETCRGLSTAAGHQVPVPYADLLEISSRYGIGTAEEARRTRIKDALPGWLRPIAHGVYQLVRSR